MNERIAIFSPNRRYRYYLSWPVTSSGMEPLFVKKRKKKVVAWLLLNPSIADAVKLDPTLTRCMGFSRAWGATRMDVINIFSLVSTDPHGLREVRDPIGPKNNYYIRKIVREADIVVIGWGSCGDAVERSAEVLKLLRGIKLRCLGVNSDGSPKHPLYLRSSSKLMPFPKL